MQITSAHHTPDLEEITLITNPKPTVDIRAYSMYGCWEKQSRTLTIWSYAGWHQVKGLLHRTSIALSLTRGLSQSDQLFPSVQKNLHGYQYKNKIMRRAWNVVQYLQAQPNGNRREIRNADQDAAARGVKWEVLQSMLMELCKCQQTRRCPGEDGLRIWCGMSTRNKDMPKSTTSASRLHSHPEALRSWYGNSSLKRSK